MNVNGAGLLSCVRSKLVDDWILSNKEDERFPVIFEMVIDYTVFASHEVSLFLEMLLFQKFC